jgi:hypothetical protein
MMTAETPVKIEPSDASGRLMVAGVLEILLGCLLFFVVATMGAVLAAYANGNGSAPGQLAPNILVKALMIDVLIAVAFVWVGVGLARAQRWAWALTVSASWVWLALGSVMFVHVILTVPATSAALTDKATMPPGFALLMRIVPIATSAFTYLVVPGVLLALCHHGSVRATCERRDPRTRWTDRCPLPVLALSLLFAFSMSSPFSMSDCLPVFGIYLSGAAGVAVAVLVACLMAWLAWGTYRRQPAAWWVALVVAVVGTADMFVMYAAMDLSEMYQKMGMPAEQIEPLQKAGLFALLSRYGPWLTLASGIGFLAYLAFVRRYFGSAEVPSPSVVTGFE